jgi:nicotinamide mononucleotide adenylyltransferase
MNNYEKTVTAMILKAYALVGQEDKQIQIKALAEAIIERQIDLNVLSKALDKHAETSEFAPKLKNIMDYVNNIPDTQVNEFLERFRKQSRNHYDWNPIDDDVYTIKKIIGEERCENCLAEHWVFIEKEARELYKDLRNNKIELIESPNKHNIKQIPGSNTVYIESKQNIKDGLNPLKNLLKEYK